MEQLTRPNTESSHRIRYEAYAGFAAEASQSANLDELTEVVGRKIKYLLDIFSGRFCILHQETLLLIIYSRGTAQLLDSGEGLSDCEKETLRQAVPMAFNAESLAESPWWPESPLYHPKANALVLFPIDGGGGNKMVISLTSRNPLGYNETDYRFIKLVGEFIMNKAIQLQLEDQLQQTLQSLDQRNRQIANINASLERTVSMRTRELQQTNQELSTLFYKTSHNFVRPLATLSGLLNLLQAKNGDSVSEYDMMNDVIRGLRSMLNKLTTVSNMEVTPPDYPAATELRSLTLELMQQAERTYPETRVDWHNEVPEALLVHVPQHILSPLLAELLDNSIHFAKGEQVNITLKAYPSSHGTVVEVADDGLGIPENITNQIFDLYFRGGGNHERHGLGLYVVRKLVKHFEGLIEVDASQPSGTTMRVFFPFASN